MACAISGSSLLQRGVRSPSARSCSHEFSRRIHTSVRSIRTDFKLPRRIVLVRHGESLGNVDDTSYASIPDWKIPLTRRGERQAAHAGEELHKLIKGERLFIYCSPYKRTLETWEIMKDTLQEKNDVRLVGTRQEPRIAEQQFGNFQNPKKVRTAKAERRTYGRFFFRFPNGEAGLDVYNRASSFLATFSRDLQWLEANNVPMEDLNILIVTHGLTLRLLLMRYFQLTVEEFEHSYNSQNAKLVIMDRVIREDDSEFFRLDDTSTEALNLKGEVSSEKPVYWRGDALDNDPYNDPDHR